MKHNINITADTKVTGKLRVGKKDKDGNLIGEMGDWVENHIGLQFLDDNSYDMLLQSYNTAQLAITSDFEYSYRSTRNGRLYRASNGELFIYDMKTGYGLFQGDYLTFDNGFCCYVVSGVSTSYTYMKVVPTELSTFEIDTSVSNGNLFTDVGCHVVKGSATASSASNGVYGGIISESVEDISGAGSASDSPAHYTRGYSILFRESASEQQVYGLKLGTSSNAHTAGKALIKLPSPVTVYEGEQLYVEYTYTQSTYIFEPRHYTWDELGGNPLNFYCHDVTFDDVNDIMTLRTNDDTGFLLDIGDEVQIRASTSIVHNIVSITPVNTTHAILVVDTVPDWQVGDDLNLAGTGAPEYDDVTQEIITKVDDYTYHITGTFFTNAVAGTAKFDVTNNYFDGVYTVLGKPDDNTLEITYPTFLHAGTCYIEETGGMTIQCGSPCDDRNVSAWYWNRLSWSNSNVRLCDWEAYNFDPVTRHANKDFHVSSAAFPSGGTGTVLVSTDAVTSNSGLTYASFGKKTSSVTIGALVDFPNLKQIALAVNTSNPSNTYDDMATLITFDKPIPKLLDYKMIFTVEQRMHTAFFDLIPNFPY